MRKTKKISALVLLGLLLTMVSVPVFAAADTVDTVKEEAAADTEDDSAGSKALAAAGCVGVVAAAGAIGMGIAISKTNEGIARQPEAEGKLRTSLMLGLVFIETAIIYALIVAILIIFVL